MKSFDLQMLAQIVLKYGTGETKHTLVQTWPLNRRLQSLVCGYAPVQDELVVQGGKGEKQLQWVL